MDNREDIRKWIFEPLACILSGDQYDEVALCMDIFLGRGFSHFGITDRDLSDYALSHCDVGESVAGYVMDRLAGEDKEMRKLVSGMMGLLVYNMFCHTFDRETFLGVFNHLNFLHYLSEVKDSFIAGEKPPFCLLRGCSGETSLMLAADNLDLIESELKDKDGRPCPEFAKLFSHDIRILFDGEDTRDARAVISTMLALPLKRKPEDGMAELVPIEGKPSDVKSIEPVFRNLLHSEIKYFIIYIHRILEKAGKGGNWEVV